MTSMSINNNHLLFIVRKHFFLLPRYNEIECKNYSSIILDLYFFNLLLSSHGENFKMFLWIWTNGDTILHIFTPKSKSALFFIFLFHKSKVSIKGVIVRSIFASRCSCGMIVLVNELFNWTKQLCTKLVIICRARRVYR